MAHGGFLDVLATLTPPMPGKRHHGPGNGIAGHCPDEEKPAHGGQQKTHGFDAVGRGLDVSVVMN